jgi:outer membrane autotransporter protein
MNKSFRTIWNDAVGAWVAASELDRAKGGQVASAREPACGGTGRSACARRAARQVVLPMSMRAATLLLATASTAASAQTLSWGPGGGGGSGTWDSTTANWFNGSTATPWSAGSTASFGGTAGTVTVNGTAAVGGATFNSTGYTITGGTLALSGAAATFTSNAGVSATVNSPITGSAALKKSGAGTLTFSGAQTYSGATTVDAGRLVLNNVSGFVSATTVNSGATLAFTGTTNVTTAAPITLNDGATLENSAASGYTLATGAVTTAGNTSINVNQTSGTGRGLVLDGGLHGSGTVTINAANAGNGVSLRNNNSAFSGTLVVNGIASATAGVGSGLALAGAATSNVLINTNVVLNGTIELADQGIGWANAWFTSVFNLGALSGTGIMVANRNPTGNFGATVVLGNTNDSGDFSGRIVRGSGRTNAVGVTKVGSGTQILSGANTYTGATKISGGVLSTPLLANGGVASGIGASTNAAANLILDGGTLQYTGTGASTDRRFTLTTNGGGIDASGSDALSFTNTAAIALSGAGSRTLALTGSSTAANTLAAVLGDGGGASSVVKSGTGKWVLTAGNSYTGGTFLDGGTLAVANDGNLGAASGALTFNGGTLENTSAFATSRSVTLSGGGTFQTDADLTVSGAIGGAGTLTKTGDAKLIVTGSNTYGGGTAISAGTLQLGNGGTTGSIVGNVANNGTLAFDRSDTYTFDGAIAGSGMVNQIGAGTTVLTGNSSYTGGTTISSGTLQLGNGGTSGSISGDIVDNGTLVFDRADTLGLNGVISSTGGVTQIGTGTTVLTGNNTYSGGTLITNGVLSVSTDANLGATSGAVTLDGGTLRTTADMTGTHDIRLAGAGTVHVDAGTTLTLDGTISGSGSITKAGGGTLLLAGADTQTGDTIVAAGTLKAAAANVLSAASATTVQRGATLDLNGFDQTVAALTNAGTVALSGAPGTTLAVSGNYTGASGVLQLNTLLNQGGAATRTDMLTIGGNAGGDTSIRVDGSGNGALTTGDGIRVVQVGGTSSTTAFRLAAPVQAGAYEYLLYRGGNASANDWYLRSQLEARSAQPPSDPPGAVEPPIVVAVPAYRPAVVGYTLTPALNLDYGFSVLGTLHQRMGDIAALEAAQPGHGDGVWGRIGGENGDMNGSGRFSSDARTFFAQFGKEWTLARADAGGSTRAGVTITFGTSSASFADSARSLNAALSTSTGTLTAQAQSLGGYWTRYFADQAYVDAVAQLTHYRNKYGDVYGGHASQNGFGAGGSLEVGKPWLVGQTAIAVEPQAQLAYQYLHLNGFNDGVSPVSGNTSNALRGRVGFRLFRANLENDSKTSTATPYLTANVLHDFFAPGAITVGGNPLDIKPAKTRYELGAGVTASLGKASELYVAVSYTRNLGGEYRRTIFGQGGYRYSW